MMLAAEPTWDIDTAVYASKSLSAAGQSSGVNGLAISKDGTQVYVLAYSGDTCYQYTLTTAWDLSTGSYASKSMYVGTQQLSAFGLAISDDGTKIYIVGTNITAAYQYTLSTPWDLSSGSYASKSMSVSGQSSSPNGFSLSQDGTKAYMVSPAAQAIYQYTLATPWDLSTGSYASKSFSTSSQTTAPISIAFKIDGTKAYVVGANIVYQYTLTTPWDISTAVYSGKSKDVSTEGSGMGGICINYGEYLYVLSDGNNAAYQYKLA